jgi:hydrogenase maturation protein HypF
MPATDSGASYPICLSCSPCGIIEIDPAPMWNALIDDLADNVPSSAVALRFHQGLANVLVETAIRVSGRADSAPLFDTVALTGGCFQNRILFESVAAQLRDAGFVVLAHLDVPANDGGLALGQAAIGAARMVAERKSR